MHNLILWFFRQIKNIINFCILTISFFIIMIVFNWFEVLVDGTWNWLNFIRPLLNCILDFVNSIYSFSFDAFGTNFDLKYINSTILLIIGIFILRLIHNIVDKIEDAYDDAHRAYKKASEKSFNRKLEAKVEKEEKQINKYMVLINTKIKKKFNHEEINISIDMQNKLMNEYLNKKTNKTHSIFNGGFLYYFDDFNHIDNVLDVLFKTIKSSSPLDYSICIQAYEDLDSGMANLKKLADLENFGKITFSADTLLRYKYNKSHRYGTQNVGVFQKEDSTIEVHEFKEIL